MTDQHKKMLKAIINKRGDCLEVNDSCDKCPFDYMIFNCDQWSNEKRRLVSKIMLDGE